MAPQIAGQLLSWEEERRGEEQNIDHFEWEAEQHYQWDHPGDRKGLDRVVADYAAQVNKSNNDFREKLKGIIANADFVRKARRL
jgi:hypothetical protein